MMPILTIEKLDAHMPDSRSPDALVLCIDGEVVPGQVSTMYESRVDDVSRFTVTFACIDHFIGPQLVGASKNGG